MLPKIFSSDFGEQIGSIARLVDPNNNQFEVQVDKIDGFLFLTTGFKALRDFYDLIWGGSVVMVFTGLRQFGINVVNRELKSDGSYCRFYLWSLLCLLLMMYFCVIIVMRCNSSTDFCCCSTLFAFQFRWLDSCGVRVDVLVR